MSPLLPMLLSFTWQMADAFNQPLSFDTSSVTSMQRMFQVRCVCARPSASTVGAFLHAACTAAASRRPLVYNPHVALLLCFAFHSAVRVFVQPVAEPRHVQRHRHAVDVLGALRARPTLRLQTRGLPARCTRRRLPSPFRPACRPCCHASLNTRQGASAFNQPLSLNTSSVMSTSGMFSVRSARCLPSAPTVGAFPARCMRRRRTHALPARMSPS